MTTKEPPQIDEVILQAQPPRNIHNEVPQVSLRDLRPLGEEFSMEDDEVGNPIFLRSKFCFVTDDYTVYFGHSPVRKLKLTPEDIKKNLKLVPDEEVYPVAPSHLTSVSVPIDGRAFVKKPKLLSYDCFKGTNLMSELLLQEAEILELLKRNPHPNIVRYHGCLIKRGHVVGLVLDRFPATLDQRLKNGVQNFNAELCMNGITSAARHLHSLGLAHNDLNPSNIMVDEHDSPVLIDFGSCQPFEMGLITTGTVGWVDDDFTTSAQQHDEIALNKIRLWLERTMSSR
jgi:serine/threonine protein kinase